MATIKFFINILFGLTLSQAFADGPKEYQDLYLDYVLKDPRVQQAKFHAEAILSEFPPDQFVILGLGRTTGLVLEWLRQRSQNPSREFLAGRRIVLHPVLWQSMSLYFIADYLLSFVMF